MDKKKIMDKVRIYMYFHLREVFPELNIDLLEEKARYTLYAFIVHMVI